MMTPIQKQDTTELPGVSVQIQGFSGPLEEATGTVTAGSFAPNFDQVKSILSAKPLHRPNRTKPRDL
jgi:hypothetical protein